VVRWFSVRSVGAVHDFFSAATRPPGRATMDKYLFQRDRSRRRPGSSRRGRARLKFWNQITNDPNPDSSPSKPGGEKLRIRCPPCVNCSMASHRKPAAVFFLARLGEKGRCNPAVEISPLLGPAALPTHFPDEGLSRPASTMSWDTQKISRPPFIIFETGGPTTGMPKQRSGWTLQRFNDSRIFLFPKNFRRSFPRNH